MTSFITNEELAAYLEGRLEPRRLAELRQALAEDPTLARRLGAFTEVRRLSDSVFARPAGQDEPARMTEAALMPWRPRLPRALFLWVTLAASFVLALFFALFVVLSKGDPLIAEAVQSGRLGMSPPGQARADIGGAAIDAPDLAGFGLTLAGLRADRSRETATFQYRDAGGQQITLFVRLSAQRVRFQVTQRGGLQLCIWQDGVLSAVLAGPLNAAEMMRLTAASVAALESQSWASSKATMKRQK
jgi:anti-sigma factor RsiW